MSNILDERVEYAIQQIWLDPWNGDGAEAKKKLEEAVEDGNADACFFLARCYFGRCFVNPRFGFEENDEKGHELLEHSIELGSAIGMLGAKRVGGFQPRSGKYIHAPYSSWKEVWETVNNYANQGQVFCQYLIGNAYYYGDCIEFLGVPADKINTATIQNFQNKAIQYLEDCVKKGLHLGIGNLIDIYTSGDYGMPVNKRRAKELEKIGADMGVGFYENEIGSSLVKTDPDQAKSYFERAISHGDANAYLQLALMYMYEGAYPIDLKKALSLLKEGYEKDPDDWGFANYLGYLYFRGGDDIAPDYTKAVQYFEKAIEESKWCSDMLGTCYLNGLGTTQDYNKARELFLYYPNKELSALGLGKIYCYGLGVKQEIKKGMAYLKTIPKNQEAKEVKTHFKRSLFGWKQII